MESKLGKITKTFKVAGKEIAVSTGRFSPQAAGSIFLQMGGTVLMADVTVDKKDSELDYFPLGVEYIEKMYARGAVSGSRFKKREGLPAEEAIIKAREVDHSIRSLFPKSFKRAVSVVLTVLAYDGENDPQALTVLGTSLALMQSGIPFYGPCSSVVVCLNKDNDVVINPSAKGREEFLAEFILSGVDNKVLSFEGWGKEIAEEKMNEILDKANNAIVELNKQQVEFISKIEKSLDIDPNAYDNKPAPAELIELVKEIKYNEIEDAIFNDKIDRMTKISEIKSQIEEKISENEEKGFTGLEVDLAVEYVARKIVRDAILKEGKRVIPRGLDEIRKMEADVSILPTVHGSAMFQRELTQSLSIVTLAPQSSELIIDEMEGETTKTFMHHYNMPGYASGEAGRFNYHPGRREIGHGAIGENAIKTVLPDSESFPYTIRVVSEIMSSNGSTSMAATCAASMALMDAGVPIKEAVGGISVGLVTNDENEDDYKLILDIEGLEDYYGDMDFKVCGTKNGVTAIQYENKLRGVKIDILKEAFVMAKKGREEVLEVMNRAISSPKDDVAENAPKVVTVQIEQDQIGELIGPGGKNIKELIEDAKIYGNVEPDIKIDDDGSVRITAVKKEQMDFLTNRIVKMFEKPVVGEEYEGVVGKIMTFGAFVDVSKSISGLVHVSEMSDQFVKDPNTVVKQGQLVRVKVLKIDDMGRVNFTMKGVKQPA